MGGGEELVIVTTDNAGRIAAVARSWRGVSTDAFSIPTMIEEARLKFGPMLTGAWATDSQGGVAVFRTTDGAVVPGADAEDFLADRCYDPLRRFLWGGVVVTARTEIPARCGASVLVLLRARQLMIPGPPGQRPMDSIVNELIDFQALRRMIAGG